MKIDRNKYPVIPGFHCLEMKWKIQEAIYEKIKNMSPTEELAYWKSRREQLEEKYNITKK